MHLAMRFWHPFAKDVLREISNEGCRVLKVVPLAPYSGHVYGGEMQRLAEAQRTSGSPPPELVCAPNWGQEPLLVEAFARSLGAALARLPAPRRSAAHVLFTAHSLPVAIVEKGDPYPREVEATAKTVADLAKLTNPWRVVYQSQGATPDPWLGPDVRHSLTDVARQGAKDVVLCPFGFLGTMSRSSTTSMWRPRRGLNRWGHPDAHRFAECLSVSCRGSRCSCRTTSTRREVPRVLKLGLERAGHQIADRLLRRLALVEHAIHLRGDRHVDAELATQIVGALGGPHALGDVT